MDDEFDVWDLPFEASPLPAPSGAQDPNPRLTPAPRGALDFSGADTLDAVEPPLAQPEDAWDVPLPAAEPDAPAGPPSNSVPPEAAPQDVWDLPFEAQAPQTSPQPAAAQSINTPDVWDIPLPAHPENVTDPDRNLLERMTFPDVREWAAENLPDVPALWVPGVSDLEKGETRDAYEEWQAGWNRAATSAVGGLVANVDPALGKLIADTGAEQTVKSFTEIAKSDNKVDTAVRWLAGIGGSSAPEMALLIGTGGAVGAARGAFAATGAMYGESVLFHEGRNLLRQYEENGETDIALAAGAALGQAALDVIAPGRVVNQAAGAGIKASLAGLLSRRGLGEVALTSVIEGSTETAQQFLEQLSANPQAARIVLAPRTPEELQQQEQYLNEYVESFVGGAALGGGVSAATVGAQAVQTATATPSEVGTPVPTADMSVPEGAKRLTLQDLEDLDAEMRGDDDALATPAPDEPGQTMRAPVADVEIEFRMGPKRPNPPKKQLLSSVGLVAERALGPGSKVVITSGQEDKGEQHGSHRHGTGLSADVQFYDPEGRQVTYKDPRWLTIADTAAASGIEGIGYSSDASYMGGAHMHLDLVGDRPVNGRRGTNAWGGGPQGGKARLNDLVGIMRQHGGQRLDVEPRDRYAQRVRQARTDDYGERLAQIESGGDPNAKNPRSSALGTHQFISSTWLAYAKRELPKETAGKTDAQILAMRRNPRLEAVVFDAFTEDNAAVLRKNDLPVVNATLGMLHRFGPARGVELIRAAQANPDQSLAQVLPAQVLAQNPDLKDETAGSILNWYEQKLGQGNTFLPDDPDLQRSRIAHTETRRQPVMDPDTGEQQLDETGKPAFEEVEVEVDEEPSPVESAVGRLDVERADGTGAVPFTELTGAQAAAVLAEETYEAVRRNHGDAAPQMAEELNRFLRTTSDPEGGPQAVVNFASELAMGRIPEGFSVPKGTTRAQLRQASRDALAAFGFDARGVTREAPLDITKPVFTAFPPADTAKLVRDVFDPANPTAISREEMAEPIVEIMSAARAHVQNAFEAATAATQATTTGSKARRPKRIAAQATQLVAEVDAGLQGVQALMGQGTQAFGPPGKIADRRAAGAVVSMFDALQNARDAEFAPARRAMSHVRAALRAYQMQPMPRQGASEGFHGDEFFTRLRQAVDELSLPPETSARLHTRVEHLAGQTEEKAKAVRRTVRAAESEREKGAAEHRERRQLTRAQDKIRIEREIEQSIRPEQARRARKIASNGMVTALHLLHGGEPVKLRSDAVVDRELRRFATTLGWPFRQIDKLAPGEFNKKWREFQPLLSALPVRSIARFYDQHLKPVQYGYRRVNPLMGIHYAKVSGHELSRVILDAASSTQVKIQEIWRAVKEIGEAGMVRANEQLADLTNRASAYRVFISDTRRGHTGEPVLLSEEEAKGKAYDKWVEEGRKDEEPERPVNAHLWRAGDGFSDPVRRLLGEFENAGDAMHEAAGHYTLAYKRAGDEIRLQVINNIRVTEYGLDPVDSLSRAEKLFADGENMLMPKAQREIIEDILTSSRDGNFKPLMRNGDYYVTAKQTIEIRKDSPEKAERAYREMAKENPHLRPSNRQLQPEAKLDGNEWVVKAELPYFKMFESKRKAEAARALLKDAETNGIPDLFADGTMRGFKPDPGSTSVVTLDNLDSPFAHSGISDAHAAQLKKLSGSNLDIRNFLLSIMPYSRVAASIAPRQNVLGMSDDALGDFQVDMTRIARSAAHMKSRPEITRMISEMEAQKEVAIGSQKEVLGALITYMARREAMYGGTKRPILSWLNAKASEIGMLWFLAGPSNVMMNMAQVTQIGVPQFAARYGARAANKVFLKSIAQNAGMLRHTGWMLGKHFKRRNNPKDIQDIVDFYGESSNLDYRVAQEVEKSHQLGYDVSEYKWAQVANKPYPGEDTFARDPNTNNAQTLLISEMEFNQFVEKKITLERLKLYSASRRGGHLGPVFQEARQKLELAQPDLGRAMKRLGRARRNAYDFVTTVWPSAVEYANRRSVVDAVYELEKAKRGGGELSDADIADIEAIANELNAIINVDYSTANRSILAYRMGALAQFSTFPITFALETITQLTALVRPMKGLGYTRKQAADALVGTTLTTFMFAGALGAISFPIYLAAKMLAYAMTLLWDDDEEKAASIWALGFDTKFRDQLSQALGPEWADVLYEGPLASATGVSTRMRFGANQAPMGGLEGTFFGGEEGLQKLLYEMFPPVGLVGRLFEGGLALSQKEGMDAKDFDRLLPKIGADISRATRMAMGEGVKDNAGLTVVPGENLSPWDALRQGLGWTPLEVSQTWERRSLQYEIDEVDRPAMVKAAHRALWERDIEKWRELVREINQTYPEQPYTGESARRAIKDRVKAETTAKMTGGLRELNTAGSRMVERIYGAPEER